MPFEVKSAHTATRSVSTSSARVALSGLPSSGKVQVRLVNDGTSTAFLEFGDSAVLATVAAGYPIALSVTEVITLDLDAATITHMAAITSTGTANVYATVGDGV